jgi:hypothetical protein
VVGSLHGDYKVQVAGAGGGPYIRPIGGLLQQ